MPCHIFTPKMSTEKPQGQAKFTPPEGSPAYQEAAYKAFLTYGKVWPGQNQLLGRKYAEFAFQMTRMEFRHWVGDRIANLHGLDFDPTQPFILAALNLHSHYTGTAELSRNLVESLRLYLEAILVSWDTTREDDFERAVKELINLALAG